MKRPATAASRREELLKHEHVPDIAVPPWPRSTPEAMLEIMAGDRDAVSMMGDLAVWTHIYDDLVDCDKPVSETHIHELMWRVLVTLPTNPFWRRHEALLRPLLITGILNWRAANDIEARGNLEELRIAHAIRYSICDIGLLAMFLAGGHDHAVQYARQARLMFQHDTWAHYRGEHHKEPAVAGE